MTTHEILVGARNLIDREGWVQVHFGGRGGPYCMVGAINEVNARAGAAGEGRWREPSRVLCSVIGWGLPTPMLWNDKKGRTKEEVLAAFDKAIAATAPLPVDPLEPSPQEEAREVAHATA